mmetsp:Transcript_135953/g.378908  ORF Transcript_135953/g.378908 Transcript_135953/m.378908 type:complete len:330 (-) Transcript_135953:23-1012(-)
MGGDAANPRIIEVRVDDDDSVPQATVAEAQATKAAVGAGGGTATSGGTATGKSAAAEGAEHSGKPVPQASSKPAAAALTATSPAQAPAPSASKPAVRPASKVSDGLSDEVLTQIAQAKFEAQEEKLRDVARQSMALLRDYGKLTAGECDRRVAEIRKSLLKYEMQYIRAWASQERRRRLETEALEGEAERCRQEAEAEGGKIAELRRVLDRERRRRKRYERYEQLAEEVNRKKSRTDSQAEIDAATAEIKRLRQAQSELEALVEQRNQRAQLLRHAVAELKQDLKREQQLSSEVFDGPGAGSTGSTGSGGGASGKASQPGGATDVEVIS